jgi:hypothetical protein
MAITYLGNGMLRGLSTDTKPTTYPAGTRFFETNTGAEFYYTGSAWSAIAGGGGGSGETNTASNLGAGQGWYKTKSGVDLQFRSLTATSSKIAVANNTNDVGLDVTEANLTHDNIGGILGIAKGGTGLTTRGDVGINNTNSPYTALTTSRIIRVDASAGAVTINLPTAVGIAGFEYHIFRTDIQASTNIVTIDANSTETIDSSLVHYLYSGEFVRLESDGANWQVITRTQPAARLFIKGSTANRKHVAGHMGNIGNLTTTTTSPSANTLYAMPLIVERTTQYDLISFRVGTLSTSGSVRVGIYRDNGNIYPGPLLFDSGVIDTSTGSTTTTRDTTITSSVQVFQPGVYWLTFETNSATGQYGCHSSSNITMSFTGHEPNMSAIQNGWGYSVSHTFGTLPDPYPGGAAINVTAPSATNPQPALGLRPI